MTTKNLLVSVEALASQLKGRLQGMVKVQEPLASHTSFRIGGPCDLWVEPRSIEELEMVTQMSRQADQALFVMGAGTNLLVRDSGFRGTVVNLREPAFQQIEVTDAQIRAGCGVSLAQLIHSAHCAGLMGCEFLAGIPGTVGGAVAVNAGTNREWISQITDRLRCLATNGEVITYSKEELAFGYRQGPCHDDELILEALFQLTPGDREEIGRQIRRHLDYRNATQETALPCAGCIFRNPEGESSGRLIELAGLKGKRIGGAQVSVKHANFIVNVDEATYRDIACLIDLIRNTIRAEFGLWLELEVQIL